jgi:hypothetical protein
MENTRCYLIQIQRSAFRKWCWRGWSVLVWYSRQYVWNNRYFIQFTFTTCSKSYWIGKGMLCVKSSNYERNVTHFGNVYLQQSYEIGGLSMRTANETYKTLSNDLQLQSTDKTTITEITSLSPILDDFSFVRLNQLESMPINVVIGESWLISYHRSE